MKSSTPININSQPTKKEGSSLSHTPTYKPSNEHKNEADKITSIPELAKTTSSKSKMSNTDKVAKSGSDKKAKEKEKKLK